ncbi:MAG: glycoside hydrolase family 3 C-terminal domain-containing protein, partial [Polyangiaceae bacterium]|nr:glycoside hydrolase family 3 C-terminal domain-containing protein [Polyangiaceae bacterium]
FAEPNCPGSELRREHSPFPSLMFLDHGSLLAHSRAFLGVHQLGGSSLAVNWADEHVGAILQAFYPGQATGTALADVLFGDYNPAGRLPITYPRSLADIPEFTDYSLIGRTYRYLSAPPLYPFGYGLSYTTFEYSELELSQARISTSDTLDVSVRVRNTGTSAGEEVVQLYVSDVEASVRVPHRELRGFARIYLAPGEERFLKFRVTPKMLALVDEFGAHVLEPGEFLLSVGGSQPDERSLELTGAPPQKARFAVVGQTRKFVDKA